MKHFLKRMNDVDQALFYRVDDFFEHRLWIPFARCCTYAGEAFTYLIIVPVVLCLVSPNQLNLILLTFFLGLIIEKTTYLILKNKIKRERPCNQLKGIRAAIAPPDKFSLPSGHSASATCTAMILSHFFPPLTLLFVVTAGAICFSRVLLRVHFPLDVAAGIALGIAASKIAIAWATS